MADPAFATTTSEFSVKDPNEFENQLSQLGFSEEKSGGWGPWYKRTGTDLFQLFAYDDFSSMCVDFEAIGHEHAQWWARQFTRHPCGELDTWEWIKTCLPEGEHVGVVGIYNEKLTDVGGWATLITPKSITTMSVYDLFRENNIDAAHKGRLKTVEIEP